MSCYKHGHCSSDGDSPEYKTWVSMKQRCNCKSHTNYPKYGGRGIRVSEDWTKFENFIRDMGNRPIGKSLERIDNEKGYSKENCRWATQQEQCNNTRRNIFLEFDGQSKTVADWARITGIPYAILLTRVKKLKWPIEKALTTLPRKMKNRNNLPL